MADPSTPVLSPPAPAGRPGWLRRRLSAVRARPGRTALRLALTFLVLAGATAGGAYLYFDHHLSAARAELARGHNAAATRHLQKCRDLRPEQRDVLLLAARISRRSGAWDEAERLLDRYWERYGDDDRVVFERLLLRATRGEIEAAGPALLDRIDAGGADATVAREALVGGLVYRFHWPEAERQLGLWLTADPDNTSGLLLRGKFNEQRLKASEAMLDYRRVLDLDAEHDEARLRLTTLLLQQRQGEEALAHLEYLRRRLPDNPEVHVQWAKALALQGRTADARAALEDCVRKHPDAPAALAELGRYALADGDDAAAEDYFARSLEMDPGNAATRHQYYLVLSRAGKPAEAAKQQESIQRLEADAERIDRLIQTLQRTPDDPAVHHDIATIALRAGQLTEALRWLKSAVQVGPDYVPAHRTLAVYYQETGNPVLAARHRAIAQRLDGLKGP